MLVSMAIRMKEWGLLAYPRQAVHLPLNALNDWGRTGRSLGKGVQELGHGLAELEPVIAKVSQVGQQADAVALLHEIGQETTEELLSLPVRDWDYSWKQAYEPRVQEMLSQFSGEEREQARKLSSELGARFSLHGRREMELHRIGTARNQWQQQVDNAVQRGDEHAACQWVEQGRDVFVPEADMNRQLDEVRSRSVQADWQHRLQQNPYAALSAWQQADARKPEDAQALKAVESSMEKVRAGLFNELAGQLAATIEQGDEVDVGVLQQAVSAGVLPAAAAAGVEQEQTPLSVADTCNWLRRIDERAEADDAALTVDIALAPIPVAQRRLLLQRLQATGAVPSQRRSAMSRTLWNLYRSGGFGCPGDAESLLHLGRMQEEGLMRMVSEPEKDTQKWLEQLHHRADTWVCFDEQ